MKPVHYDIAVLGGGPGGYAAALRAALRGKSVCCVEMGQIGGCCLNVGCIPTKAMLYASRLAWTLTHAGELGLACREQRVDGAAFMARVQKVVAGLRKGVEQLLSARKVQIVRGRGKFLAPDLLCVQTSQGEIRLQARSIIIATGSRPARPAFLPWDSGRVLTTDEAASAAELPKSILIVGGGVIGCEFATIYAELGISTTLVEMQPNLLPAMEAEVSRAATSSLQQRGVRLRLGMQVAAARASADAVTAELSDGSAVAASHVLVAVGRPANVQDIGLEKLGLEVANGIIPVDDHCRTGVAGVYAVGDVAEPRQYAHLASRMGIVAADNATSHEAVDARDVVPIGVYTHPELASVGLSEPAARQAEPQVKVSRFPYSASGMAHAYGHTEGVVKLVAAASGRLLGATVIGYGSTETIQELTLALRKGLSIADVAETIHPHPTFVEAIGEAAQAWLDLPLHSLR